MLWVNDTCKTSSSLASHDTHTLSESVLMDKVVFFLVDEEDPQRLLRPIELSPEELGVCPTDA